MRHTQNSYEKDSQHCTQKLENRWAQRLIHRTTKVADAMKHKELYTEIVKMLAQSSKDPRLKVGAILLKDGRIVATGYNGQLRGHPHKPLMIGGHDISTVHAEMNVISFCSKNGISTDGCEMITTHSPCQICTKLIVQAGIKKVYYIEPYRIEENPFIKYVAAEWMGRL